MKISVLIPCYNEEKTIERCILSCLSQTREPDEIVVVNDGSTDGTLSILEKYADRIVIVDLEKNTGNKSFAEEKGLAYVTGDAFITTDADTVMHKEFVARIAKAFEDKNIMCVSGYVRSQKYNYLTALREIDYLIAQNIHKRAQELINAIIVVPGCAAAYRTEFFRKEIGFDHVSITEDMEFTFKLNMRGQIIRFDRKAIVFTQDPHDLRSYIHQMRRWYLGGWQNLFRYNGMLKRIQQRFELGLMYSETFIFSSILIVLPFINLKFFSFLILFQLVIAALIAVYGARKFGRKDLLIYFPIYPVIAYMNAILFVHAFFRALFARKGSSFAWVSPQRRDT